MEKQVMVVDTRAGGESLAAELQEYALQFEALKAECSELTSSLTDTQFAWKPEPTRWSIGECITHLSLTGELYLPPLDEAMAQARARGRFSQEPFRHGWIGRFIVHSMEPPPRFKAKTFRSITPPAGEPMDVVVPGFMKVHDRLLQRVRQANGLDLSRIRITSPLAKLLRLDLGMCFAFLAAHGRRHLWQAGQVKETPGFPHSMGGLRSP